TWAASAPAVASWRVATFADDESTPRAAPCCGDCRNWLNRQEPDGRGECDHPGSGFSYPYRETAACPFFEPRSRYDGR
ncbi:MAG TPA: hypothetical protein VFA70_00725, partial [Dehalococcoidia bacterium]|nr:hypothetical protein [Dehalococcoidia bacterium]